MVSETERSAADEAAMHGEELVAMREPTVGPIERGYTGLALLVLNTCLLFALLNLLVAGLFAARAVWRERQADPNDPVVGPYSPKEAETYPGWSREDLVALRRETADASWLEYESFTEFKPPVVRGRF